MNKIIRTLCFGLTIALSAGVTVEANAQNNVGVRSGKNTSAIPDSKPCNLPVPTIMGSTSLCFPGTDTLTVSAPGVGVTYLWAPGGQTTQTIEVASTGISTTYTAYTTNGCGTVSDTIVINYGDPAYVNLTTPNNYICAGTTIQITGIPNTGSNVRYLWTNNGSTSSSITVTPLVTTTYTANIFADSTTCTGIDSLTIHVFPKIISTIGMSLDSVCSGQATTLFVASSGGNPPGYQWSNGATTSSITIHPTADTLYWVFISGNCADDSLGEKVIVVNPNVVVTTGPTDTVCAGTHITLSASGASSYYWDNGSTTSSSIFKVNADSTFTVVGTVGNCHVPITQNVMIYSNVKGSNYNDTICAEGGSIIAFASGGHAPYTYAWSNGITNTTAGPFNVTTPPYSYTCTITDGCPGSPPAVDNITMLTWPGSVPSFLLSPDTLITAGQYITVLNYTNGNNSYLWNFGDGTTSADSAPPIHQYKATGFYNICLHVTTSHGCHSDSCLHLDVIAGPVIIPNVFTPNGDGVNDVFHITMTDMASYDIKIFDRWGVRLFEADSPNIDWSGRNTSGVMQSDGTYYYIIKATDYSGNAHDYKGFVQLLQ